MSAESNRRQYDREFKLEAVRLSREAGRTVAGVARDLGISENMLHRWRSQFAQEGHGAFRTGGPQLAVGFSSPIPIRSLSHPS